MNLREQYRQVARGRSGVESPNMDNGPLLAAYERWQGEGLNPELDPRRYDEWCDAFGLDRYYFCAGVGTVKQPLFQEEILEETETTVTRRMGDGSVNEDNKGSHKSIPHEIRPAVTSRDEWERLKAWMDVTGSLPSPDDPVVAPILKQARVSTSPVRLCVGSMLDMPRNIVPLLPNKTVAGIAFTVKSAPNVKITGEMTFRIKMPDDMHEDSFVVWDTSKGEKSTLWGGVMTATAVGKNGGYF